MCEGETLPMDEDGSAERQIQSVFDFLDEPDDLNRGLEYWGANPRHSLTEQEDDDEILEHKTVADSSDDDVRESLSAPPWTTQPVCYRTTPLIPDCHKSFGTRAFHVAAAKIRNSVPLHICQSQTLPLDVILRPATQHK